MGSTVYGFYIALISGYLCIIVTYVYIINRRRVIRTKKEDERLQDAYEMLDRGFAENTFQDDDDIFLVYRKIITSHFSISYTDFLEYYIIYLRKRNTESGVIVNVSNKIKEIIKNENSKKPFEGVNDHERRLLMTIEEAAKNNEKTSIMSSLTELSDILISNQARLKSAITTNHWTIPLSIIGFVLTFISFIFSFMPLNKDNKLTVDDIKTTMIEVIQQKDEIQQD